MQTGPHPPSPTEQAAYAFLSPHLPPPRSSAAPAVPFLTLTYAQSVDGFIAKRDGRPLALSSPFSSVLTHALRASHDAILIGVTTAVNDDPSLTTRCVAYDVTGTHPAQSPIPVILDSGLRTPVTAKVLRIPRPRRGSDSDSKVVIITTRDHDAERKRALEAAGAVVVVVASDAHGRVDFPSALHALAHHGIRSVMVEGGATVIGNVLQSANVKIDLLVVTLAPVILGRGVHAVGGGASAGGGSQPSEKVAEEEEPPRLVDVQWKQFGPDMVMLAKTARPSPA
ncbi:dihydrofolate reductase-like domain-containing protein [Powellomyces hirtus]|nr:dihydrofolate reductase-like domain-containing protein [Powellomyces hirtus]